MQVVAGGDVSGRGDHGEEEREARNRDMNGHNVRRYLLLDVRSGKFTSSHFPIHMFFMFLQPP